MAGLTRIYLCDGRLVHASKDMKDFTYAEEDPKAAALKACKTETDGLFLIDLTDARKDEACAKTLDVIMEICASCGPFIAACGNLERAEDVKKLLYAGCDAVVWMPETLSVTKDGGRQVKEKEALFTETKERFGEGAVLAADDVEDAYQKACALYAKKRLTPALSFDQLKKNEQGLVPVIVTDVTNGQVLMLAYMNAEAYDKTFLTGRMHYYSRERKKLWMKGEESGHFQYVKSVRADCDSDTLLTEVRQIGSACHTGERSCFFREVASSDKNKKALQNVLSQVSAVIADRKAHPKEGSYTSYLFDKGIDKILKKLGEESTEIVIAAKNANAQEMTYEIADYLYHLMVLMCERDITWEDVFDELSRR